MNLTYGGRVHALDPAMLAIKRMVPLCAIKTKASPSPTIGKVTCVKCLTRLGQDIPDGARRERVVYGERSGFGWTIIRPGRYQADVPDGRGVTRMWWLDRINGTWYLIGPDGRSYGPMRGPDGDRRLLAAIDVASPHINAYADETRA